MPERAVEVGLDFDMKLSFSLVACICNCKYFRPNLLHMQIDSELGPAAARFDRLVDESLPGRRGEQAWRALLQAHATLIRQLDTDLRENTGLRLADFDVLAQLAAADGELRMTELAARTLISRSGLTRRIARLVDEGLVRRENATQDGRGVTVALTAAGVARVTETVPVHLRGVSKLFVERLDDHELAVLQTALRKVIVDCTFG
jgi:DNA-binding MarR family transcriptional regulator